MAVEAFGMGSSLLSGASRGRLAPLVGNGMVQAASVVSGGFVVGTAEVDDGSAAADGCGAADGPLAGVFAFSSVKRRDAGTRDSR